HDGRYFRASGHEYGRWPEQGHDAVTGTSRGASSMALTPNTIHGGQATTRRCSSHACRMRRDEGLRLTSRSETAPRNYHRVSWVEGRDERFVEIASEFAR